MANRDYTIRSPDGREMVINGPDTATDDQLRAAAERAFAPPPQQAPATVSAAAPQSGGALQAFIDQARVALPRMGAALRDVPAGLLRGAGSIGATALTSPASPDEQRQLGMRVTPTGDERRAEMDAALTTLGANTESVPFKVGKFGAEVAGTAGMGGLLAGGARAVPALSRLAPALESSGFNLGGQGGNVLSRLGLRVAGGAGTGGASAGLVDPKDAALGATVGGAVPALARVAGATGRALGQGVTGAISPERQALAERAGALGIRLPADRIANSKALNAVAAGLNYVPFSGRAAVERNLQDDMNRALSHTFGEDTDNATRALAQAQHRLGGEFDTALARGVTFDQQLLTDVQGTLRQASTELGTEGLAAIRNQIAEMADKVGQAGTIDGQAAYNIKQALDRISARNSPEAFHARRLRTNLMDALNRSLGPQDAARFARTRQQYGTMSDVEDLVQANGLHGDVSIAKLANLPNIRNPQLKELADIAQEFARPREGQHGAAQRASAAVIAATLAGPVGLATGMAGGRLVNTALTSGIARRAMLRPGTPPGLLPPPNALRLLGARALPVALADQ